MNWVTVCAAVVLITVSATAAAADPGDEAFQRGFEAFQKRDYGEAAKQWSAAAALGQPRAQNGLGVLYRDGMGVKKDPATAVRWFAQSAARGYAFGMYNLALMYRDGIAVKRDPIEAYKWFYLASTLNYDEIAARDVYRLESQLDDAQITEAKRRAQEWFDRFFFGRTMNERG